MFDFLKPKSEDSLMDVKTIRNRLLLFIKEQLQRWEGEGTRIKGMQLFLAPPATDIHLYETVVYYPEEDRFKMEEVEKIADDYAIELPHNWTMDLLFVDQLPEEAVKAKDLPVALHLVTNKQPTINKPATALISVLSGEAEQGNYTITAREGRIYIGRDHQTQTPEGFYRINTIAFPGTSTNEGNKYISRQHAHIEWNSEAGCFFLFADEGGIPPRNKVKVQTEDGTLIKLQATQIGHPLKDGDQIILGESALLLFNYIKSE